MRPARKLLVPLFLIIVGLGLFFFQQSPPTYDGTGYRSRLESTRSCPDWSGIQPPKW